MGADPGHKQQPPQHHESWNLFFFGLAHRGHRSIAFQPLLDQAGYLGQVLVKRQRRSGVVHIPTKAAIIEVDHFDFALVQQQIGQPQVAVSQTKAVRAAAITRQAFPDQLRCAAKQIEPGCVHAQRIAPTAPARSLSQSGLKVPGESLKTVRPLPFSAVRVHLRRDRPQTPETLAQDPYRSRVDGRFPIQREPRFAVLRSGRGTTWTHSPLSPATGTGVATTPSLRSATSQAISEASEFSD